MSLNELAKKVYENSVDHGWWEKELDFGYLVSMIHSEASEIFEDWRRGREIDSISWVTTTTVTGTYVKPVGIPIEFADVILMVLVMVGRYKVDIDTAIEEKMSYNKDRPYRHGNLRA
jgi:NTP pyrophosphatase (non-canonical NTP hydrolase)